MNELYYKDKYRERNEQRLKEIRSITSKKIGKKNKGKGYKTMIMIKI